MSAPDGEWLGYSHEEIYAMVTTGPGAAASEDAASAWATISFFVHFIDGGLAAAIGRIGAGWEGAGAEATSAALTPLGTWAKEAANNGEATARTLRNQADYAGFTRSSMPEPRYANVSDHATGTDVTPETVIAHAEVVAQRDNDAARARELMATYSSNSHDSYPGVLGWTAPPQVVVDGRAGATEGLGAGPGAGGGVGGGLGRMDTASLAPAGSPAAVAGGAPGAGPGSGGAGAAGAGGLGVGGAGGGAAAGGPGVGGVGSAGGGPGGIGAAPGVVPPGGGTRSGAGGFRPVVPGAPRPGAATATPRTPFGTGGGGGLGTRAPMMPGRPGAGSSAPGSSPGSRFDTGRVDSRPGSWGSGGYRPSVPGVPEPAAPRGSAGAPGGPGSAGPGTSQWGAGAGSAAENRAAGARGTAGGHPGMMPMAGGAGGGGGEGRRGASYLVDDSGAFDVEPYHVSPVIGGDDYL